MKTLVKNVTIVSDHEKKVSDVLVSDFRFEKIDSVIDVKADVEIDGTGLVMLPGVIDTHVHFREPGYTNKATILSESSAAVAGGVTSFMDMPNTKPDATSLDVLEEKYKLASQSSMANYSFYLGTNGYNIEEIKRMNRNTICGVTDDGLYFKDGALCNRPDLLEKVMKSTDAIVALHCEQEDIIAKTSSVFKFSLRNAITPEKHTMFRSREACFEASKKVVELAKETGARVHLLHLSTMDELALLEDSPLSKNKRITAEICLPHLMFSYNNYKELGYKMKVNPSIKLESDRQKLIAALLTNKIDTIGSDHAPHLLSEKEGGYDEVKSGMPGVGHSLLSLLEKYKKGIISLEQVVNKMCHNPANLFQILERGYIREGYFADFVLVDMNANEVKPSISYACGWSPYEQTTYSTQIKATYVNGVQAYSEGRVQALPAGMRLHFAVEN